MLFNITPATIKALTKFVQVLEQSPRGGRMLILFILAEGFAAALTQLPSLLA